MSQSVFREFKKILKHLNTIMETSSKKSTSENSENKNEMPNKTYIKSDLETINKNAQFTLNNAEGRYTNKFLLACVIGISLGILLEVINAVNRNTPDNRLCNDKNKYWVYSATSDVHNKNGFLKHVHLVLDRIGYEKSTNDTPWELLWSHDYPFRVLYPNLHKLKVRQKVNHFPGTGYITHKVDLATTDSKYIPKAFKLPKNKKEFFIYAEKNKNALFLEKNNKHRGVFLKNVTEVDVSSGESFVQEYIQNPFLVDGHKFDIGVYVVLTSVDPLRVYWYKGDVLFRYCPAKYYPFDPKNLDKYVVGDDYLPTWEVPSLAHPYTALGFSMKDAFDIYVRSKGKDPAPMWEEVQNAISEVFINKEHHIVEALKNYPSGDNFFEMMRFDLVVNEELKVYLLEANMSPNLSSAHYAPNQLLYEQVLYNLFSLTGVKNQGNCVKDANQREYAAAKNMVSSQKNIAVFGSECWTLCKADCESSQFCKLCRPCLDAKLKNSLLAAHTEFLDKGDFRRLIPPSMVPLKSLGYEWAVPLRRHRPIRIRVTGSECVVPSIPAANYVHRDMKSLEENLQNLTPKNKLQYLWYQGKCNEDITWCT